MAGADVGTILALRAKRFHARCTLSLRGKTLSPSRLTMRVIVPAGKKLASGRRTDLVIHPEVSAEGVFEWSLAVRVLLFERHRHRIREVARRTGVIVADPG